MKNYRPIGSVLTLDIIFCLGNHKSTLAEEAMQLPRSAPLERGFVCEGSIIPDPRGGYGNFDYNGHQIDGVATTAIYVKKLNDQLGSTNSQLTAIAGNLAQLITIETATQKLLNDQIDAFNKQLRKAIADRFDALPAI
jgi:hypothetical protein